MKKLSARNRTRPDDAPLTAAELRTGRKLSGAHLEAFKKAVRGRPAGRTKEVTSVSFDREVLEQLRRHKGWQTWLNALARAALDMHK